MPHNECNNQRLTELDPRTFDVTRELTFDQGDSTHLVVNYEEMYLMHTSTDECIHLASALGMKTDSPLFVSVNWSHACNQ